MRNGSWVLVALMVGLLCADSGTLRAVEQAPLLDELLQLDESILQVDSAAQANEAAQRLGARLDSCGAREIDATAREACLVRGLLGGDPPALATAVDDKDPAQNTVSYALVNGRGSCAALVAVVLALTDRCGSPLDAVILRDHVVLASRAQRHVYYEVLERGRRILAPDARGLRRAQPGGPVRVDARGFVPYYLDNLGARLAEAGDGDRVTRAFTRALELDSGAARIHYNFGSFLVERGSAADAMYHLSRAIRLGWRDPDAYVNRGVAYWQAGNVKAARRDFRRALKLDPDDARARENLQKLDEGPPASSVHEGR